MQKVNNRMSRESEASLKNSMASPVANTTNLSDEKKFTPPENWVNAPEFVPKNFVAYQSPSNSTPQPEARSYAAVVGEGDTCTGEKGSSNHGTEEMCPYAMVGECRYGEQCVLLHGNMCDYCGQFCLHPYDPVQREQHTKDCIQQHEQDMELSFAIARSSDKTCGICMEVVMEKSPPGEQRFGILPSCNHCYCLACLRKWRQARQFENKICRSCPECRVTSDFICPSRFWVESKEDKEKLIVSYKSALSKKSCRYYKNGTGECPFGNKCFYLHALPNGTVVDVGPPRRKPKRVQADGQEVPPPPGGSIWDFLYDWELQWLDVEDFMDIFSSDFEDESDDDDEASDYPSFYL
ncbi:unnamed protein product [Allacma fusca]|uniref:RING-type E3 ubiquitin transferase n=1 Tax=Allacma fusca TaxID=39272 RepID=A0A8J2Q6P2_9HEXA|nr:unnamed protein product [Allacma fusca]